MTTKELKIVNGPSATALISAFKYAYGVDKVEIDFTLSDDRGKAKHVFRACINGIRHESGDADSFIVYANLRDIKKPNVSGKSVEMYYNSHSRKGHVIKSS